MAENNNSISDSAEKAFAAAAAQKAAEKAEASSNARKQDDVTPVSGAKADVKNEAAPAPALAVVAKADSSGEAKPVVAEPAAVIKIEAEPEAKAAKPVRAVKPKAEDKPRVAKVEAIKPADKAETAAKPEAAVTVVKAAKEKAAAGKPGKSGEEIADKVQGAVKDAQAKVQDAVKDAQARAKAAFEKNKERLSEVGEFTKGNIEAIRESGKILATGVKNLGKTYVEQTKSNVAVMRADVQEFKGVRSPKQFVKLQGAMIRKYFDTARAANSKQGEAVRKLASEAIKPISGRVSLAVEKVKVEKVKKAA